MFSSRLFSIYRMQNVSAGKQALADSGETIAADITPVDQEFGMQGQGSFSKTFSLRSKNTSSSLKEGDKLVSGDDEFTVKGVSRYEVGLRHLSAVIERIIKQ